MTEPRIRWSDDRGFGCVGTIGPFMFQIVRVYLDAKWMLTADGLGRAFKDREPRSNDMDELKDQAERWLEEFVTSLGAIFPGGHPDGNAIEAYCATGTGDAGHLLQYAVRLPDGTTKAYGDQSWVESGLGARDHEEGSSTVVRDIWVSYGPWRTHGTSPATAGEE